MKSYIENAFINGVYRLECQFYGLTRENFVSLLKNIDLVSYGTPKNQSLSEVWGLRLNFTDGFSLEFSSKCTGVGDWDELGSLSVLKKEKNVDEEDIYKTTIIDPFCIAEVDFVVYEMDNIYCESGILLKNSKGEKITIVAGISPGSVSISAPFSQVDFKPELNCTDYKLKPI